MAKRTLHILLSMLILANGMVYSLIQLDFYIYQDKITELFCINKDVPEMACNGKCELGKRLDNAQENEESKSQFLQEQANWIYLKPHRAYSLFQDWKSYHPEFSVIDESSDILIFLNDFFHPPQSQFL